MNEAGDHRSTFRFRLKGHLGMRTKSWRIFRMSNIRYTNAQRLKALEVFDRTQSVTKTVRELGYPGRWTLHLWIRQRSEPPSSPIRRTTLKRYPFTTKLKAVELFNSGMSPDAVAAELSLNSKMSVYAWAQRFREEGRARPPKSGHVGGRAPQIKMRPMATRRPDTLLLLNPASPRECDSSHRWTHSYLGYCGIIQRRCERARIRECIS